MIVIKLNIFQCKVHFGDAEKNISEVTRLFHEAHLSEDDVVVLPEMWTSGYDLEHIENYADHKLKETLTVISDLAQHYRVNVVAGSVPNIKNGDVYNTAFYVSKDGELKYQYDKMHLVPMLDEPKFLAGGDQIAEVFNINDDSVGLTICYDLRFPELFRYLALNGAKVIFVVAEWPLERKDHWLTLLKARAIENQCYIVGCNTIETQDNGATFAGNSVVYNPFGAVIIQGSTDKEEILTANLDLSYIDKVRQDIPIFNSRRKDLYKYL